MATTQFGLLDEREEGELHKIRLLNVEEKPFKRLTKRLIAPGAFTNPNSTKLPTPPPESNQAESQDGTANASSQTATPDITALKEDITLDFAAFDSAIARLQLLASANEAERQRYADDRLRILRTMDSVREGNAALRTRLEGARATLAQRRKFDELADRITGNRMLRTRAEQHANLAKLADECADLERESEDYGATWRERRGQFERLVEEGKRLRALIRDEKEEVERREGMDTGDNNDEAEGATPAGTKSGNATPRPEHAALGTGAASLGPKAEGEGGATPRPGSRGERTPRLGSPAPGAGSEGLKPNPDGGGSLSSWANSQVPSVRAGSQDPSARAESQQLKGGELEEGEDVEMGESGTQQQADTPMSEETREREGATESLETQETPQIAIDAAADGDKDDKMDTT
ncbi:hypothetical protein DL766_002324 [Monosporascus sp. MC13-8B]|uniref:Uncharacterized protein n=1 Tax=Monosporascus cannonballus TaxID=155416 RepID=A0ABY0HF33_9PEZI|nr:hypothetical protein DL762_001909 [Monosporascus cannonballus]RYO99066.1 hypothetical protein DL763_001768 [Monosporascus cannonballus]RYP35857.1 hypothetical protein DL766_002324 [Monosporascus sp. MC13-8B]